MPSVTSRCWPSAAFPIVDAAYRWFLRRRWQVRRQLDTAEVAELQTPGMRCSAQLRIKGVTWSKSFLPLLSIVLLLLVISERPAEAYIDPGTASYVFQVIAGCRPWRCFLLRTYWTRVVTTLRSLVSRDAARRP